MKTILFTNQKGGVGKTLLADSVAFHFEKSSKVSFIDLDMQGGAIHQTNTLSDADYQVIDTPGALTEEMSDWMASADLVIIPTKCNSQDMAPLERMMEIAAEFPKEKFIIVFNQWNRCLGTAEFINWFTLSYPGYKTFFMPNSAALTDASARALYIGDYKPKHKAALAMTDFMNLIEKSLGE